MRQGGHGEVEVLQVGLPLDLGLVHREKPRAGLDFWFFPRHGWSKIENVHYTVQEEISLSYHITNPDVRNVSCSPLVT